MLQQAIDEIWQRIRWVERPVRKRKIRGVRYTAKRPSILPKSRKFKHHVLRHSHGGWGYRSTADSTIKQAYLIPRSWRRNCLKGECPRVRRRFVRIKETLYVLRDRKLRITLEPRKRYL